MEKVLAVVKKVYDWVTTNGASVVGIAQAFVKLAKEIVTAVINVLCPVFGDKFDEVVYKVRDVINVVDEALERVKEWLLKLGK